MMLEFSPNVRQAATVFTAYRNTIDIYTEDREKDKEFYVKLLKRLLVDADVIVNDIYPLGCRREVIRRCQEDTNTGRGKLYIVDGDIYLQYREKEKIPNLFVLDAYCIENFVVCEDAVCGAAYNFYGEAPYETVKSVLKIPDILGRISEALINLFFWYSIQMECLGQFHLLHIDMYMDKKNGCLDEKKVNEKINEIRDNLVQNGISKTNIDKLFEVRKSKFPYGVESLLKIVSGKDYLLPFLKSYTNKQLGLKSQVSKEVWKFNLVDNCDISQLCLLKDAIIAAKAV